MTGASVLHDVLITIVPRVLLDLAPRLSPTDLTRACHEARITTVRRRAT